MNSKVEEENTISIEGAENIESLDILATTTCDKLLITGLKQESFDYLIDHYGHKFKEIDFFKCPLISDLSRLEKLDEIESISFYWNQRAVKLWDLSKNKNLLSITLDDFTRLHSLQDLMLSDSLLEVSFGDRVWSSFVLDSLSPLSNIKNLKKLTFSAKKIEDLQIAPIANIKNLTELEFPTNLFSTEKVAWLKAKVGVNVKSSVLAPYKKITNPISDNGKQIDTFIIGKRKPSLDSKLDIKRVEKYVLKFNSLVEYYNENPGEVEPA